MIDGSIHPFVVVGLWRWVDFDELYRAIQRRQNDLFEELKITLGECVRGLVKLAAPVGKSDGDVFAWKERKEAVDKDFGYR